MTPMRDRQKQRQLHWAGVRREERIGPRNAEEYFDLTPREAVERIVNERKERIRCLTKRSAKR